MKKLILSAAIVLGGLTAASAQTEKEPTALNTPQKTAVEAQVETQLDAVQEPTVEAEVVAKTTQDYKEVKASEVPQAVKDAVTADFKGSTISKAYVNANGEYKIQIAGADKKASTVYANAQGEWIKNDAKDSMKKQ